MVTVALRHLGLAALLTLTGSPLIAQSIRGRVIEANSGEPVAGAHITLVNQSGNPVAATLTSARGRFDLPVPTAGSYRLRVSHLGYEDSMSEPIEVGNAGTIAVILRVDLRAIQVDSLVVTVERRVRYLEQAGFYHRQGLELGHFVTRDQIEQRRAARNVGELLRNIPSVRVVTAMEVDQNARANDFDILLRGGGRMFVRDTCLPTIAIDGAVIRRGGIQSTDLIGLNAILPEPQDIEAIEIYAGATGLPAWAAGSTSPCGAILVWTIR